MQLLTTLPTAAQLHIPASSANQLIQHLKEPFTSDELAQQFWDECPSLLLVVESLDNAQTLNCLEAGIQKTIVMALDNPEYTQQIDDLTVSLAITNDAGNGLYLVTPSSLDLMKLREWLAHD